MINAQQELLQVLNSIKKNQSDISWMLVYTADYSEISEAFTSIDQLDFTYDSGYGTQKLFGVVFFNDNTWLERGEYDGSEWWDYITTPTLEQWREKYSIEKVYISRFHY